jgi:hypothetical protein
VVETGDRSPSAVADEVVSWLGPAVRPTGAAADD